MCDIMKALLMHCKNYEAIVRKKPRNPDNIVENTGEEELKSEKCIVAWISAEKGDTEETSSKIADDIEKMSGEVGVDNIVVFPFAHLSSNLASPKDGLKAMIQIEEKLKDKLKVKRGHFGSNKELLVHIYGHPGNARFREY